MNDFDKKLDFDSDTFENMKHDMNFVLQRLLGNMIEKNNPGAKELADGMEKCVGKPSLQEIEKIKKSNRR